MSTATVITLPPLRNGDHLSANEFMRRYEAMPQVNKAELIEGVVYMPSSVTADEHGTPHALIMGWLAMYWAKTPGVECADNATLLLQKGESRLQPDGLLRIKPSHGGQTRTLNKYVVGGPELIAEVAASSASIDLYEKLQVYKNNLVSEYVVWQVEDEKIDWFVLSRSEYKRMARSPEGYYKSKKFAGLWLDPHAAIALDMENVLIVLQKGIDSPGHRKFVEKLSSQRAPR